MINDAYSMGDLMRVATRRAEQLGVTLKWGDPNEAPSCTKEKVITFPIVSIPMSEEEAIKLRGATIHEPLHLVRSETFDLLEAKGDALTDYYMMVWNLLEDAVMEREHCARYYGDKVDLGTALNLHVTSHIEKMKAAPPLVGDTVKFAALLGLYLHSRLPWDTIGTSQYYPFMSGMGADAKGLAEELIK